MKRLFVTYAAWRLRLFVREILQLHQRFLLGFLLFFGFVLSGNEQFLIREAFAHLLSNQAAGPGDRGLVALMMFYAWVVAAAVRKSARGGRVRFMVESFPLPFAWERAVRCLLLNGINLTMIVLLFMGFGQLIHKGGNAFVGLVLGLAFYLWILSLQLSLLERSWRMMPLALLGVGVLTESRGGWSLALGLAATLGMVYSQWRRNEARLHDHPGWSIQNLRARWRSWVGWLVPARLQMQMAWSLMKPGALFSILLAGFGVNFILYMVLKQKVPMTQKIYVYAFGTGFLCFMLSSFFRNFHLARQEYQIWLQSLPQPPAFWIRQDTVFVGGLYALAVVPFAVLTTVRQDIPLPVPFVVLSLQALGILGIRRIQRSARVDAALFLMIGSVLWFLLIGYITDSL